MTKPECEHKNLDDRVCQDCGKYIPLEDYAPDYMSLAHDEMENPQ